MKNPIPTVAYFIYRKLRQEADMLFLKTLDCKVHNETMARLRGWLFKCYPCKDITNEVL